MSQSVGLALVTAMHSVLFVATRPQWPDLLPSVHSPANHNITNFISVNHKINFCKQEKPYNMNQICSQGQQWQDQDQE